MLISLLAFQATVMEKVLELLDWLINVTFPFQNNVELQIFYIQDIILNIAQRFSPLVMAAILLSYTII